MSQSTRKMMQGAVVLSIAAFITKILSAVYRVPFQNLVGNTGFYVYQQVYPLYGIGMTFALSGFPVFLSNLVAQYAQDYALERLLRRSFVLMGVLGGIVFAVLMMFASTLARWMGDAQLTPVIQSVAWMFLTMPFLVVGRGYFQGTMRMMPTAISQVVEQVVRVAVIIAAASLYLRATDDLYVMGTWAMSSATIAALAAMSVLGFYLWQERRAFRIEGTALLPPVPSDATRWRVLLKRFVLEGGTICLLSSILVLYQLVDSFTLFKGLVDQGIASDLAKDMKGIFDRGQPLVQLGMVVGVGFSSSYMPLLTRAFTRGQLREFAQLKYSLLKMTTTFAIVATVGMSLILPRLNHMLFGDIEGNTVLLVYVWSVFVASMLMSYHGLLQSMGRYHITLLALVAGLIVKAIGNILFVAWRQTLGASLATIAGLIVMLGIVHALTPQTNTHEVEKQDFFKRLSIVVLGMAITVSIAANIAEAWLPAGNSRIVDTIIALILVTLGVVVFLVFALRTDLFTVREWVMIPKGKSVLRFAKKWTKKEKIHEIR